MSGFGCRVELEDYRVQCRGAVAACLQKTYLPRVWVFAPMLRAERLDCPTEVLVTHFLVLSVKSQSMNQRAAEVVRVKSIILILVWC